MRYHDSISVALFIVSKDAIDMMRLGIVDSITGLVLMISDRHIRTSELLPYDLVMSQTHRIMLLWQLDSIELICGYQ